MPTTAHVACSEVWGGNRATEAALVLPGVQGWVYSRPYHDASAGGDLHYVSSCGTGRITRVLLADVAGHGESVAAVATQLRGLMQRYLNHIDPHKLAERINRDLITQANDPGTFATAIVLTFFAPSGKLSICNAGHPAPLLYRSASQTWSALDQPDTQAQVANLPLGILEESGYVGRELTLQPDDMLLIYTDCLSEARNAGNRLLGTAGLLDAINELEHDPALLNASELIQNLIVQINRMGYALDDDLTAVVLRCTERSGGVPWPQRISGLTRSMLAPFRGRRLPWPQATLTNVIGFFLPRYTGR